MTRKNHSPLPRSLLQLFSRLHQIHELTNPSRIANRHGVTAEYVRRQWRETPYADMKSLAERLERFLQAE